MVSWKLGLGIAALAGVFIFRDKIAGALSSLGGSLGAGLGGFGGSFASGLGSGFNVTAPLGAVAGGTTQIQTPQTPIQQSANWLDSLLALSQITPLGGIGYTLAKPELDALRVVDSSPTNQATSGNIGGSQNSFTDKTVTPYNRDFSDSIAKNVRVSQTVKSLPTTIGHAERARIATAAVGFSPAGDFKKNLPMLRAQGLNVAQAYKIWSGQR